MNIELFNINNIDSICDGKIYNKKLELDYYKLLIKDRSKIARNLSYDFNVLVVNDFIFPISIAKKYHKNENYLTSFLNQFIEYSREEVLKSQNFNFLEKIIARYFLPIVKFILKNLNSEKIVFVNNLFLSTNLYPDMFSFPINDVTEFLVSKFPNHAISYRSVNELTEIEFQKRLVKNGYKKVICRQVYMINNDNKKYLKKRGNVQDRKLFEKSKGLFWEKVKSLNLDELKTVKKYYNDLYLKKHSKYNPDYTIYFIKKALKFKFLDFYVLRSTINNEIKAVQAINIKNNVITTPFIGYDQSEPIELGLYRLMSWKLIELSLEKNYILNLSSGASNFKTQRGAIPVFDVHMFYTKHLKSKRIYLWNLLFRISDKFIKNGMQNHKI